MSFRPYPFRTPGLLMKLMPGVIWKVNPTEKKVLYLTFDDGPTPEATSYVLDLLNQYDAKATFFVVGENVKRYPQIFERIKSNEHRVGNHTYHHISGWKTSLPTYLKDIARCDEVLKEQEGYQPLFRPPYGQITPGKIKRLKKDHQVVMWSLLSGDFDPNLNAKSSRRALMGAKPGDIVVFHDSKKSLPNLKQLLPFFLDSFHRKGYKFAAL